MKTYPSVLHERLCGLGAKYDVTIPENWRLGIRLGTGDEEVSVWGVWEDEGNFVPIFIWRCERRFIELRRIVETETLEDVVLCRFSCCSDGRTMSLGQILYREFDLLEWITGSKIVSVFGSTNEKRFSNVLARLENGTIASVEAGTTLPPGTETIDRHELVARRGVASDRVVDTHVPQQSVCLFEQNGVRSWTDTDAELFGMENDEIPAVRAAFEQAKAPESGDLNKRQHHHLLDLVGRTFHS